MRRLLAALAVALAVAACGGGAEVAPLVPSLAPADTPAPTPTPSPTPKPLAVKVVKVTKSASPRDKVSLTVETKKGADCSIVVEYESGVSEAKGLGDKEANSEGVVKWTWTVGSNANPQKVPVVVVCELKGAVGSDDASFTVK